MELRLSDDQKLIRETTVRFIADVFPLSEVRRFAEGEREADSAYIQTAAELGWFSMLVPEEQGGGSVSGEGLRDLAIIAEERGRALQPGRFIGSNVVAHCLARSPSSEQRSDVLDSILAGDQTAAWVAGANVWSPGSGIVATREADGYRLSGEVRMVPDAAQAQLLLITAREDEAITQFLLPATESRALVTNLRTLDLTQNFASVALQDVVVPDSAVLGEPEHLENAVEVQLQLALVLTVAETVGAADALLTLAIEYAKERTAFGRPIGSFQALKHQLADLSLSLEAAKAIAVQATRSVQAQATGCGTMARIAKTWTNEMAIAIAQGCLQVFGGIGYTWEHDLHLFLRRLTINSELYGGSRWQRERIYETRLAPANQAAAT